MRKLLILFFVFSFQLGIATPPIATLQQGKNSISGLVALWHMNFDEDPIRDSSANSYVGTLAGTGGPTFTASGKIGGAYDFDGDDYINLNTASITGASNWTIILWFKSSDTTHWKVLYSEGDSTAITWKRIGLNDAQDVIFGIYDDNTTSGGITAAGTYSDDKWYMAAWVRRANNDREAYINAVSVGTNTTALAAVTTDNTLIGALNTNNAGVANHFYDLVDEVAVYNRALSVGEIELLYRRNPRCSIGN